VLTIHQMTISFWCSWNQNW